AGLRRAGRALVEAWRRDTELLLAEREEWRAEAASAVWLPPRLSVSSLVMMARDPAELARQSLLPMPRPPAPAGRPRAPPPRRPAGAPRSTAGWRSGSASSA